MRSVFLSGDNADDELFSTVIAVDVFVANIWLGCLLFAISRWRAPPHPHTHTPRATGGGNRPYYSGRGCRIRLPTAERLFWHCGDHTAKPESA